MTQCARPSGPDACTESSDLFRRGFSRGGITFITWAAVASSAANFSSSSMSAVASMAADDDLGNAEHQCSVEDAAERLDVGHPRVAAVPDRVRRPAPRQSEPELVLPRDDQLVVPGRGIERLVGVLLEVVRPRQGGVEQDRLRGRDGRAAAPEDGDVEGVQPRLLEAELGGDLTGRVHLRDAGGQHEAGGGEVGAVLLVALDDPVLLAGGVEVVDARGQAGLDDLGAEPAERARRCCRRPRRRGTARSATRRRGSPRRPRSRRSRCRRRGTPSRS